MSNEFTKAMLEAGKAQGYTPEEFLKELSFAVICAAGICIDEKKVNQYKITVEDDTHKNSLVITRMPLINHKDSNK